MTKGTKGQVGGRKEAPVAVVGSSGVSPDQPQTRMYTPEDAEYQGYSELLKGFAEKLVRWQELLTAREYYRGFHGNEEKFSASVIRSDQGFTLSSEVRPSELPWSLMYHNPNEVLEISWQEVHGLGPNHRHMYFSSHAGPAAEQLLDNLDGQPIKIAWIAIEDERSSESDYAELVIGEHRLISAPFSYLSFRSVSYRLDRKSSTLTLSRASLDVHDEFLPVPYQTHLFNTLDSLFPHTTSPTPETERSVTPEPPPLALPHPGRRPVG